MEAVIFIQISGGSLPVEVAGKIKDVPGVKEVMLISGDWDIMVKFEYEHMEKLSEFVVSRLRKENNISKTETIIVLDRIK
ncbi:Lrp/AsnC ligand binding domain-containing protein [Candidatus Parvarchaeota archaeon]|nr:Lrp/AsnC ligand binding domain-containing protein [Candidatus Parvarchaeota archaeon]